MIQTPKSQIEKQIDELRKKISGGGSGTGKWLDDDHTSVAHNDLENNTSEGMYDNVDGYDNQLTGPSTISQSGNLSNGGNTVTGQHNRLTNCTDTLVSGRRNILSNSYDTIVIGDSNNIASAMCSIICGGLNTVSSLIVGVVISGRGNTVTANDCGVFGKGHSITREDSLTCGEYADNTNYMFAIGNGNSSTSRSNSFTIDYSGNVRAAGTITPGGADYAEYFEWADGNPEKEDRRGMLVTLDGDKIVPANGDDILGVISGCASVIGNACDLYWHGKYAKDIYGRIITTPGGEPLISPDYDPEQEYIPRTQRPEWSPVGLVGRLTVRDNGKCEIGGRVSARRGIAVKTTERTGIRVLRRIDETHIEVLIK